VTLVSMNDSDVEALRAYAIRPSSPFREILMTQPAQRPLVLLACSDEWLSRSFESVFEQHGYAVSRVRSGAHTIRLARRSEPDVVVLEEGNGDLDALRVCAALATDPLFDHTVPIVVTSATPVTAATRHAAYAAGAWEYCSHPVDLEALMLKLATFQRARLESSSRRGERFVDRETGLYTLSGFERVAEQIDARARRRREALACVTIGARDAASVAGIPVYDDTASDRFATVIDVCRSHGRKSDVVAQLTKSRVVILAPDTDADGARLLVDRLRRALTGTAGHSHGTRPPALRAGYCAVSDLAESGIEATELVRRASTALDSPGTKDRNTGAIEFDDPPRAD
jgi:DNA-binding response OmpR family regulator